MTLERTGPRNGLAIGVVAVVGLTVVLGWMLSRMGGPPSGSSSDGKADLVLYCAAGMQPAIEKIRADYLAETGRDVLVQYGGSNTLLSTIEVAQTGDLFLAAEEGYIVQARGKGLVDESLEIARVRPVIAVKRGNPKGIRGVEDLLRADVRVGLGNPDQAAVGKETRKLLKASGHWERLERHATEKGVFKPTVPEIAADVKLGSVDAAIVWDATVRMSAADLEAVTAPELSAGTATVALGVLRSARDPQAALRFLRYVGANDRGLKRFAELGYEVVEGDDWAEHPELTFYVGTVNRRAVEPTIAAFEEREGVRVNAVYNGCGILTAQMATINSQHGGRGFPDTYLACDVYYLKTVQELFQDATAISRTEVVIAVPKGNPKGIRTLRDLASPGMRVSVGNHEQCTIGVITKDMLEAEGLFAPVMRNVVTQTPTSGLLVPGVVTGSVDATLCYATDTLAEGDKIEAVRIGTPSCVAVQPLSIARSSRHKHTARRLYDAVMKSRAAFEAAGFEWRTEPIRDLTLPDEPPASGAPPSTVAPPANGAADPAKEPAGGTGAARLDGPRSRQEVVVRRGEGGSRGPAPPETPDESRARFVRSAA